MILNWESLLFLLSFAARLWDLPNINVTAPDSHARNGGKKRGEVKGEYRRIWGEEEGKNADYGEMVQHSAKGVEWRLGTEVLTIISMVDLY